MDLQLVSGFVGALAFVLLLAYLWEYTLRPPGAAAATRFERFLTAAGMVVLAAILAAATWYRRQLRK